MKTFSQFSESIARTLVKKIPWKDTAAKVAGTVVAAKSGEKLLKDLLGTPSRPKSNDWDINPKDDIDSELNVKQGQAKDKAKNKEFDRDIEAFGKTIDPKTGKSNLSPEDQITRLKDAASKHRKNKKNKVVPMRKPKK